MFLKFTGCTVSKTIGTLFIDVGVSFVPVASQKGIFLLTPRYTY